MIPAVLLFIFSRQAVAGADKALAEAVKPVVLVTAYSDKGEALTEGTGFFASADGAIVTNYHVIGIADKVKVTAGGLEIALEGVIYTDRENDIVILKAKGRGFPAVRFAEASKMRAGDEAYLAASSEESGTILHKGQFKELKREASGRRLINISASVPHGGSGSPVFDRDGNAVGIVTSLIRRSGDVIVAVPSDIFIGKVNKPAISSINETVKNYRKSADYLFYLGYFLLETGANKEAAQVLKEAVRMRPGFSDAYYYLGIASENSGRDNDAIKAYKEAVRLSPDFADAHFSLGAAYSGKGMYNESLEALRQAVKLDNDFADAYYYMGIACTNLKMMREGIEAYQNAARLKPDFAEAHYSLGVLYLASNNKAAAIEQEEMLRGLNKELADKLRGLIGKRMGD